jgi:RNA polymerase sigma factor (sigma-70 family)
MVSVVSRPDKNSALIGIPSLRRGARPGVAHSGFPVAILNPARWRLRSLSKMGEMNFPRDLDVLLAEHGFVRRLALALVRDPDVADDLTQETWRVALERPPATSVSLRGWLASVVRSLAIDRGRSDRARAVREHDSAQIEAVPDSSEVVERLELERRVVERVRDLAEPYRTAIYLRYFEDQSPAQIAASLDVPLATVKTRVRRALELLRMDLDRDSGDRASWSALLLPLATRPESALAAQGVLVTTMTKSAAAIVLVSLLGWLVWSSATRTPEVSALRPPEARSEARVALASPTEAEKSRAAVIAPSATATVRSDATTVVRRGRVIDQARVPVAGAFVALYEPGHAEHVTRTDNEGKFAIEQVGPTPQGMMRGILAWDESGRAAVNEPRATFYSGPGRGEPELVLLPGASVSVRVVGPKGPVDGVRVELAASAWRMPFAEATTDADGIARYPHVPSGILLASALSSQGISCERVVLAPRAQQEIVLHLEPGRRVEVSVVDAATHAPIPGARVRVSESFGVSDVDMPPDQGVGTVFTTRPVSPESLVTDDRGRAVVEQLPRRGRFEAGASAPGYLAQRRNGSRQIDPDSDNLTIELRSINARTVHWPLVAGEVPNPAEGTALRLRRETLLMSYERALPGGGEGFPPTAVVVHDSAISADSVCDGLYGLIAEAPDGSLARLWVEDGASQGSPARFVKPRAIDVHVIDEHGAPVAGAVVQVVNLGNNPLAGDVATDAQGHAHVASLLPAEVHVRVDHQDRGGVDLRDHDGVLEVRRAAKHEATIALRCDGVARLPTHYRIWGQGAAFPVVDEDPRAGTVRVSCDRASDGPVQMSVSAPGFANASGTLPAEAGGRLDLDLHSAARIIVAVRMPRSREVRLVLDPWDEAKGVWKMANSGGIDSDRFDADLSGDRFSFLGLTAGRYRARDVNSGRCSASVDVREGDNAELVLDLADLARVHVVVSLPPDEKPWGGERVIVEGEEFSTVTQDGLRGSGPPDRHRAERDGSFTLYVSDAKPVKLTAAHPWLVPDREHGSAIVQGSADDVRLELVHGDEVRIPTAPFAASQLLSLRVYAWRGEPHGEPDAWFNAPVDGDVARFTGLARGTWNLWIDSGWKLAPALVRNVQVVEGPTLVDVPPPGLGSSVRVHVRNAEDGRAPRLYVWAHRDAEPALMRQWNSQGENPVVLTGLDAGHFVIDVGLNGQIPAATLDHREIDVDGVHDVEFEVEPPH